MPPPGVRIICVNLDLPGCIAGRKLAWDDFVRQTAPIVYAAVQRAAKKFTVQQADADDRVQDVYLRLIKNDCRLLRTFDPNRASMSTWITLITRSVVHEHYQRKRLNTVTLENFDQAASESPESIHPDISRDGLTQRQKLVVEMLFDQGLTVEEAANRLGVDHQTIRSTKHKALLRLRAQFKKARGGNPTGDSDENGDV